MGLKLAIMVTSSSIAAIIFGRGYVSGVDAIYESAIAALAFVVAAQGG